MEQTLGGGGGEGRNSKVVFQHEGVREGRKETNRFLPVGHTKAKAASLRPR